MPSLVRQLPFSDEFTTVVVQGTVYRIFPRQIIVWLSRDQGHLPIRLGPADDPAARIDPDIMWLRYVLRVRSLRPKCSSS
jgi:hypothetical protein